MLFPLTGSPLLPGELEREGAVDLGRGHIELVDRRLLRQLAAPGPGRTGGRATRYRDA